jgi:hypothetical protein
MTKPTTVTSYGKIILPKPTEEEMLQIIDTELSIYRDFGDCREGEVYQAIRAAITDYFRLREKVEEWSNKAEKELKQILPNTVNWGVALTLIVLARDMVKFTKKNRFANIDKNHEDY